jgi:adenosylcobinamide-phosphate synthase
MEVAFALLAVALAVDAVFGEPEWLWSRVTHPVILAGRMVETLDARLNRGNARHVTGAVAVGILVVFGAAAGFVVEWLPGGDLLAALAAAILLAHRSLTQHVEAVSTGLVHGLDEGRAAVGRIVGRDPATLDEDAVARAAIESGAENFADGVVAPAFWFLVGGLPGILIYKLVNTADSMIGHRNDKYRAFGWAAARLDDVLNFVPARLTALLFCVADLSLAGLKAAWRDARGHRSVNAGWPEAAMAALIDVRLAGPRTYDGATVEDPWMHPEGRPTAGPDEIMDSVNLLWRAWSVMLAGCLVAALLF